jgi:amidophosphoribosyltransferase
MSDRLEAGSGAEKPREACGLMGVWGVAAAAEVIHAGLFAQQHRGQEGAGIVVSDGQELHVHKGAGLVQEVFNGGRLRELDGTLGIGHVRYSTCGSSRLDNVQPLVAECADGIWAIAHNGNLTNAARLRRAYQESGSIFQTTTDSEVLIHLLADPFYRNRIRRVGRALAELQGAFAFVLMTRDCVMAARDPHGFKPLVIGRLGQGYVFASESCALRQIGAEDLREVAPGEVVTAGSAGLESYRFAEPRAQEARCIFELVYFARPDSHVFGYNVHQTRVAYGMQLAREHPVAADVVIPIPDSGMSAAIGYARESGIPLDMGFIRNHYVGRTFIMPEAGQRAAGADFKLAVLPETVAGRRLIVVDDSIMRGNTARKRVALLRACGATEVHVRVASPPTRHPCYHGIDFASASELVAADRDVAAICQWIGADTLGYLSEVGLLAPFQDGERNFCRACFTGCYPAGVANAPGKMALEGTIQRSPERTDARSGEQ